MIGKYVLVRSVDAGVFFAILQKCVVGQIVTVELTDSRNIWSWSEANTLNEMSLHGVGENSKISEPVKNQTIIGVCEIIECSPKAIKNLKRSRWN